MVCVSFSLLLLPQEYSLLRGSVQYIHSKSTLPFSPSLCLCLQLSISVFLHQPPPISASNIFNPHCWDSGGLLFLMQPHPDYKIYSAISVLLMRCYLSIIVRHKVKPRQDGNRGQERGETAASRMQRTIRILSLSRPCCSNTVM